MYDCSATGHHLTGDLSVARDEVELERRNSSRRHLERVLPYNSANRLQGFSGICPLRSVSRAFQINSAGKHGLPEDLVIGQKRHIVRGGPCSEVGLCLCSRPIAGTLERIGGERYA